MGIKNLKSHENIYMNSCLCYIFSFFVSAAASYHPVHVSILNIEFATGKPTIDFAFKMFTSDFELAIAHNYSVALNLGKANESPESLNYITKYFSNTIVIKINNNYQPKLVFKKKEFNEDAVWLHFFIPIDKKIKDLDITDMVLMDIYEDQTNLMIISINGKESGFRLTTSKPDAKIKI